MNPKSKNSIGLISLYWRVIFYNAFFLFVTRPVLRVFAICQHHHFRFIGKTKIIGDKHFIGDCEEFSKRLHKEDPPMYENLFINNKFVFIQYSDYKLQNYMFGEYAVPARYQKLKADGVGAIMIWGFYCTELIGRTPGSQTRVFSQPGYSRIIKKKTFTWLSEHHFPEIILEWYSRDLEKTSRVKN